jgi:hypothetical protein
MGQTLSAVCHVEVNLERHRIRVPRAISTIVPWLKPEKGIECFGFPGPYGGVHVTPVGRRAEAIYERVRKVVEKEPPLMDDVASPVVRLAAFFAGSFPLDFRFEPSSKRYSIIITKAVRKCGLLPAAGLLTLVAVNEVLELWPKDEWAQHQRLTSRDLEIIASQLAEDDEDDD